MTSGPIKWDSSFTCFLTKAESNRLVSGQLEIEFLDIIVNKLLHLLDYPYWQRKCKIEAHWQFDGSARSDIVFATYGSTSSDGNGLSTAVDYANAREVSFFIKEVSCKLIPMSTSSMLVQYVVLNLGCIQAALGWFNTSIFPRSSQLNIGLHSCYAQITMFESRCLKYAIIDPFIYTHIGRNRNDDWDRLGIWAMQCQLSDYPCILIGLVGEGKFNLFLALQYRSDIELIPLSSLCLLVCTLVPIKEDSILTWQVSLHIDIHIEHIDICRSHFDE